MKMCCTEIMKNIKDLEKRKSQLVDFERRNDCDTYLSGEKVVSTPYSYEDTKKELSQIDSVIRYLKVSLAKSNIETILDDFNISISEGLIYLSQLNKALYDLQIQASRDELTRKTAYARRDDVVEYTKIKYDLNKAKEVYKKTLQTIYKLQMAIDRSNLLTYIDLDENKLKINV